MKFTNKNFAAILSFLILVTPFVFSVIVLPHISLAQDNTAPSEPSNTAPANPDDGRIHNPLEPTTSIPELIDKILGGIIYIAGPIIGLAIVYSGFLFVSARGKPEAITKAKEAFFYTLIGAAILLGAVALSELIKATIESLKA